MGRGSVELLRKAVRGDLSDACARLDACGADGELIALAKDCLAAEAGERPRDAGVVAARCQDYLGSLEQRMRKAELERAASAARAEEAGRRVLVERQRRQYQLGLAASVLLLSALGGLSFTYWMQQRQSRAARVELALKEATVLRDQALAAADDVAKWEVAVKSVELALREQPGQGESSARLAALQGEVEKGLTAARRDRTLLEAAADVRVSKQDLGTDGTDDAYARAFRIAGSDLDVLAPEKVGAALRARPVAVALAAAAALDDWALERRRGGARVERWRRPLEAARAADPEPFREKVRLALLDPDEKSREAALRALAAGPNAAELPPASAVLLAESLRSLKAAEPAVALLRALAGRHPEDLWANYELAAALEALRPSPRDEVVRCYSAARSIRPETAHQLAHVLDRMGRGEEALVVFDDLTERRPVDARNLTCYAICLKERGRREAAQLLDRAVAAGREAIRLKPHEADAHNNLGIALNSQGKLDEAVAAYRDAIRLKPDYAEAHCNLGGILRQQGNYTEALALYRKGHELGSTRRDWRYPSTRWIAETEQMAALADRLPAMLKGDDHPRDTGDRLAIGQMCYDTKRYAAAARFWGEALAVDPKLGGDLKAEHRYNAACAAALAESGKGKDDPAPDDSARAKLRLQALAWLRADLALRAKQLDKGTVAARQEVQRVVNHWTEDPDLVGVRDQGALAKLPNGEQQAWRALWKDVDTLLKKARGGRP